MRRVFAIACFIALTLTACQNKQGGAPSAAQLIAESTPPLVLIGQVPLVSVKGRFDHFASGSHSRWEIPPATESGERIAASGDRKIPITTTASGSKLPLLLSEVHPLIRVVTRPEAKKLAF